MTVIGVLGAGGALGRASAIALRALGYEALYLTTRSGSSELWPHSVDVRNGEAVRALSKACRVVVNCAGPTLATGHRVERWVLDAGADFIDVNDPDEGGAPAHVVPRGKVAVVAAGQMPGLAATLAALLVRGAHGPLHLTARVGGPYAFTRAAAYDFVERLLHPRGAALAAVRAQRAKPGVLAAQHDVELPCFRGRVDAVPYLLDEVVQLARAAQIDALDWFTVFAGEQTRRWLAAQRAGLARDVTREQAARQLARASHADCAAGGAYQTLSYQLRHRDGTRSLVLTATDPPALSGTAVALAVHAIVTGSLRPGRHRLASCLSPEATWDHLARQPWVVGARRCEGPLAERTSEEGIL